MSLSDPVEEGDVYQVARTRQSALHCPNSREPGLAEFDNSRAAPQSH
jgi:hypothetical protein